MERLIYWFLGIDKKSLYILAALVASLTVFNFAFVPATGWLRLFWNLSGYAVLLVVYKLAGLSLADIGLDKKYLKSGLIYGGSIVLLIAGVLGLTLIVNPAMFSDPRYHQSLSSALYASLVLLPLKTVFFEELAFRGILPALLMKFKNNRWFATIISSLGFGLWHITSAATIGSYHIGASIVVPKLLVILAVWLFTSVAGVILCELRWRSKSLVAPTVVHWFINGAGMILAALSWL